MSLNSLKTNSKNGIKSGVLNLKKKSNCAVAFSLNSRNEIKFYITSAKLFDWTLATKVLLF